MDELNHRGQAKLPVTLVFTRVPSFGKSFFLSSRGRRKNKSAPRCLFHLERLTSVAESCCACECDRSRTGDTFLPPIFVIRSGRVSASSLRGRGRWEWTSQPRISTVSGELPLFFFTVRLVDQTWPLKFTHHPPAYAEFCLFTTRQGAALWPVHQIRVWDLMVF